MKIFAKLALFCFFLFSALPCIFAGIEDPIAILDALPPPEVKYEAAPLNSYPENKAEKTTPDIVEPAAPALPAPTINAKKLIEKNTPRAVKSLANLVENLATAEATASAKVPGSSIATDAAVTIEKAKIATDSRKIRIVNEKTRVYDNFLALKSNPALTSLQTSLNDYYLTFSEAFLLSMSTSAEEQDSTGDEEGEDAADEGGKTFDAVFAKAKGLQSKQKWKEILDLFDQNPEAGETAEGLEHIVEAQMNATKPNIMAIKRSGEKLVELDQKSAWGNYALAMYYYNAKKPNTSKAASHLDKALKSKNPPPGAANLYWMTLLKKLWIVILLLVGAIIGGLNHLIKKRKAAAIVTEVDQPSEADEVPKEKPALLQKLQPLFERLAPLLNKLKKKKSSETAVEQKQSAVVENLPQSSAQPDENEDEDESEEKFDDTEMEDEDDELDSDEDAEEEEEEEEEEDSDNEGEESDEEPQEKQE